MDTLAFGYVLPPTGRTRVFHPLETCAAGAPHKKIPHTKAFVCGICYGWGFAQSRIVMRSITGWFSGSTVPLLSSTGGVLADLVDNVHAVGHIAEAGILPVQIGAVLMDDEELGGGAVRVARARHRDRAARVRQVVPDAVCVELAHNGLIRAAGAVAVRVARPAS